MARLGRHRARRRWWVGLLAVGVGVLGVVYVPRWLSSRGDDNSTPLMSTLGGGTGEAQPADTGVALRPIVPPGPPAVEIETVEVLPPRNDAEPPAPPVTAAPTTQPAVVAAVTGSADARAAMEAGFAARQRDDPVSARVNLNRALHAGLSPLDAQRIREALTQIADDTIFSRAVRPDDPLVERYTVQSGDTLGKIAKRMLVSEDLLAQVNGVADKNFIREGRTLKVIHGPFHVSISKQDHLMHVYLQDVYLRTYRVALGTNGTTPTGKWKIVNHQENPGWVDPRTGKRWHPDDPGNPIGEYWIGLEGVEGDAVGAFGYGIHGTIEPDKIGQDVSLGCIRLAPDDIAMVYKLLMPEHSYATVTE